MKKTATLLISGDLVPTESNEKMFSDGDVRQLLSYELLDVLVAADYRIFNFEAPIIDTTAPINKCGPNLRISPATINRRLIISVYYKSVIFMNPLSIDI